MASQDDAIAKIKELTVVIQDLGTDMQAGFDKLLAAQPPTPDTQPIIDEIQKTIDQVKALDITAEGVSGTHTDPPTA